MENIEKTEYIKELYGKLGVLIDEEIDKIWPIPNEAKNEREQNIKLSETLLKDYNVNMKEDTIRKIRNLNYDSELGCRKFIALCNLFNISMDDLVYGIGHKTIEYNLLEPTAIKKLAKYKKKSYSANSFLPVYASCYEVDICNKIITSDLCKDIKDMGRKYKYEHIMLENYKKNKLTKAGCKELREREKALDIKMEKDREKIDKKITKIIKTVYKKKPYKKTMIKFTPNI